MNLGIEERARDLQMSSQSQNKVNALNQDHYPLNLQCRKSESTGSLTIGSNQIAFNCKNLPVYVDVSSFPDGPINITSSSDQNGTGSIQLIKETVSPNFVLTSEQDPETGSSFLVTIAGNETTFELELSDIAATGATLNHLVQSGLNYTVNVIPSGEAHIGLTLPQGVATDSFGNPNTAATFNVAYVAPTPAPSATPTSTPTATPTATATPTVTPDPTPTATAIPSAIPSTTPAPTPTATPTPPPIVDTTPPVVTIAPISQWVNSINQNSFSVSGTCSEEGLNVSIALLNSALGPGTGAIGAGTRTLLGTSVCTNGLWSNTLDLSSATEGNNIIEASQTDLASNVGSASTGFNKDTLPPLAPTIVGVGTAPNSLNVTPTLQFLDATDANSGVATYQVQLQNAVSSAVAIDWTSGFASLQNLITAASLTNGNSYVFSLRAIDNAGNVSNSVTSLSYTAQFLELIATLTSSEPSLTHNTLITVQVGFPIPVSGLTADDFSLTNGTITNVSALALSVASPSSSYTLQISTLVDGPASISMNTNSVFDSWNHTNGAPSNTLTWTIDTTPPIAALSGAPTGTTASTSLNLSILNTDGVVSYLYKLGVTSTTDCTSMLGYNLSDISTTLPLLDSLIGIPDGSLTLCVLGRDGAGNLQSPSVATTSTWTKDTIAPTVSFTTPAVGSFANTSNVASVNLTGSCSESGSSLTLSGSVTNGSSTSTLPSATINCTNGSWSTNYDFTALIDGTISLTILSQDLAGNSGSATHTITKDTVNPTIAIGTPAANAFINLNNGSHFAVTGTCSENGNTVSFSSTPNGAGAGAGASAALGTDRPAFFVPLPMLTTN